MFKPHCTFSCAGTVGQEHTGFTKLQEHLLGQHSAGLLRKEAASHARHCGGAPAELLGTRGVKAGRPGTFQPGLERGDVRHIAAPAKQRIGNSLHRC